MLYAAPCTVSCKCAPQGEPKNTMPEYTGMAFMLNFIFAMSSHFFVTV